MINEISSRGYMSGMEGLMGISTETAPSLTSMPYFPENPGSDALTMPQTGQGESTVNRLLNLVLYLVGIMTRRTSDNSMPGFVNHCECQNASTEGASESKSSGFMGRIKDIFGGISETVEMVKDGWNKGEGFFGLVRDGWNGLKGLAKPIMDGFGGIISAPFKGIGSLFKGGLDLIKSFF